MGFAIAELNAFEGWKNLNRENLGAASHSRPVGVDYEVVLYIDTGGEVIQFEGPTLVNADVIMTMHFTPEGWRLAAIGNQLPEPGWPPRGVGIHPDDTRPPIVD